MLRHYRKILFKLDHIAYTSESPLNLLARQLNMRSTGNQHEQEYTKISECNGVREICLNDQQTRNTLSLNMMASILKHLNTDMDSKELRCIVISSMGPVWSAGHDLKELLPECSVEQQRQVFEKLLEVLASIRKAPVPVIAKVNGTVAAGGVQLVASCDMVVCSDTSSFVTPSTNIGIFASTPAVAMSRLMSNKICLDMLFTGQPITAQQALTHGLISRVVPETDLDKEMDNIIKDIKLKSRSVLALGKEFYYKQMELPLTVAYENGVAKLLENLKLADSQEGVRSFMEKRKPNWSHL